MLRELFMIFPLSLPLRLNGSKSWAYITFILLAWGQSNPHLVQAYEAIERGMTLNAHRYLSQARESPDSLVRWEAALLQGLLMARTGKHAEALRSWYYVSQQTPNSPLGLEATYWRADLLLQNRSQWLSALYLLRSLLEKSEVSPELRSAVEHRLEHFAYREADIGFLWAYLRDKDNILFPYLFPALLYHLRQGCLWTLWKVCEAEVERTCGFFSDSLRWKALVDSLPVETLKVALVLPFMATQERNSPFLEFWQGLELGLAESHSSYLVWQVEVEDSERSPARLRELFTRWEREPPHIVVGDVSWSLNRIIADFCERHGIWHAVPMNPAYPRNRFSFPLVMPADCQGYKIGILLRGKGGGSTLAFSSGRGVCLYDAEDPQAIAFVEGLRRAVPVMAYPFPTSTSDFVQRWNSLKDTIGQADWYVLGFSQEEVLGFLLHKLGRDTLYPLVVGMEGWMQLRHINLKDYHRVRFWIPQSMLIDSAAWGVINKKVMQNFFQRATLYHIQGYEAGQWIAHFSSAYSRNNLPTAEREGVLNRFLFPPRCERYKWRVWEYEKGESRLYYEER
ncbi:MAG: hypothetical protein RMJ66_05135 [Bacteroidia bacterium]|nr:hypothetical protein [Bacteroidia bacterium]MDW8134431.1 hypothetical protein [Bacteroidia bacterium]